MEGYTILIFLHVLGAVSMFTAWGIEGIVLNRFKNAPPHGTTMDMLDIYRKQGILAPVSMMVVLITGIWMMAVRWGPLPWMTISLGAVALLILLTIAAKRRLKLEPGDFCSEETSHFSELRAGVAKSLIKVYRFRMSVGIGILALMTAKPVLSGSLLIMVLAVGAGTLWAGNGTTVSLPVWLKSRIVNRKIQLEKHG